MLARVTSSPAATDRTSARRLARCCGLIPSFRRSRSEFREARPCTQSARALSPQARRALALREGHTSDGHALEYAQVLLPVSPFTETGGSFVNTEGRLQSFQGVVKPLGETRPAWKVLRVLGTLLELPGFGYDSVEGVRADCVAAIGDMASRLDNTIQCEPKPLGASAAGAGQSGLERTGIERIGEVPIYHVDGIVRRAASLQLTRDAQAAVVSLPGSLVEKLGLRQNDRVRIFQHGGEAVLPFRRDDRLPANCARIPSGCHETSGLGPLFGEIELERAAAQERVSA